MSTFSKQRLQIILAITFAVVVVVVVLLFFISKCSQCFPYPVRIFVGCSIKKLDAINNSVMFSLKFYIFYWIVVLIHDISSLKECIVFYSLWKLSVELIFKLKCKLSRLLLLQLAVFFLSFKSYVAFLQKLCLSMMFLPFIDAS